MMQILPRAELCRRLIAHTGVDPDVAMVCGHQAFSAAVGREAGASERSAMSRLVAGEATENDGDVLVRFIARASIAACEGCRERPDEHLHRLEAASILLTAEMAYRARCR